MSKLATHLPTSPERADDSFRAAVEKSPLRTVKKEMGSYTIFMQVAEGNLSTDDWRCIHCRMTFQSDLPQRASEGSQHSGIPLIYCTDQVQEAGISLEDGWIAVLEVGETHA